MVRTSFFTWGVSSGSKCKSSIRMTNTRPGAAASRERAGGNTIPSGAVAAGGGINRLKVRPPCTSMNDAMVWGWPSSRTVKFSRVRFETKRPWSSRGIASVVTSVTPARNVGWGCCAAMVATDSAATTSDHFI